MMIRFRIAGPIEAVATAPGASAGPDRVNEYADHIDAKFRRTAERNNEVAGEVANENGMTSIPAIADGIANRDRDALAKLYDVLGRRAFGLAYTVTGDATLAEDAVQDAFLALWRQAETVSPERGKVESLLMTMVHRRAIDYVRRRTRAERIRNALDFDHAELQGDDPEQMAVENTEQAAVLGELDQLPDEQKQAIELAYFRGLTHREIADETGVSIGTVKGRMRLGLGKLRTAFGLGKDRP